MNFLGVGPMELVLIMILAMIVFGPGKLPEVIRQVGTAVRDFRRTTSELSEEFHRTLEAELGETRAVVDELRQELEQHKSTVQTAATLPNKNLLAPSAPRAPKLVSEPSPQSDPEADSQSSTNGVSHEEPPTPEPSPPAWRWETASAEAAPAAAEPPTPEGAEAAEPSAAPETESPAISRRTRKPRTKPTSPAADDAAPPSSGGGSTGDEELLPPY